MKILNLGSMNIDKVYSVEHFVTPGETISASKMEIFCGGKGLNQSVALSYAGAEVYHAGIVGVDGQELYHLLENSGVHTDYLLISQDNVTGHAIIQLTPSGQNCIIILPGANGSLTEEYIDNVLSHFEAGDMLLLQNETNNIAYAMERAKSKGMAVAFNPSPITPAIEECPLELVDYYILNEVEGAALTGNCGSSNEDILHALGRRFPRSTIVLTVGKHGVLYLQNGKVLSHGIYDVPVVDTTAAGDTFCGFFLTSTIKGLSPSESLRMASLASSLVVGRKGASASIPTWEQVLEFGKTAVIV